MFLSVQKKFVYNLTERNFSTTFIRIHVILTIIKKSFKNWIWSSEAQIFVNETPKIFSEPFQRNLKKSKNKFIMFCFIFPKISLKILFHHKSFFQHVMFKNQFLKNFRKFSNYSSSYGGISNFSFDEVHIRCKQKYWRHFRNHS